MERYDGKTRRDDYIKYGLIALGACAVLGALFGLNHYMKMKYRRPADYKVVIVSQEAFDETMTGELERLFSDLAGDLNGDGYAITEVETLRITDEVAARGQDSAAVEAYWAQVDALGSAAGDPPTKRFSGLDVTSDQNRLMVDLTGGECYLFLLSEQPLGSFAGAATVYRRFFMELRSDMQSEEFPQYMDLSAAPFWAELGLEDVPFYGGVLEGDGAETAFALELLEKLSTAHLTLW